MKKELIVEFDPKNPISEIFRTLRTNIQFMNTKRNLKTILVTSTMPSEGKTWIAANLAITFAQNGKKVILIDGDMRKGRAYSLFGIKPRPGLSNYLSGIDDNEVSSNIRNYIQHTEIDNLDVIVSGNIPPNPSELINSDEMQGLLEKLKSMADIIIVDGTPSSLVADSIILSRIVDKTIVVGAYGLTKKDVLKSTITQIQNVGGSIAGVVLNRVPESASSYKKNGYYVKRPSDRILASAKLKPSNVKTPEQREAEKLEAIRKEPIVPRQVESKRDDKKQKENLKIKSATTPRHETTKVDNRKNNYSQNKKIQNQNQNQKNKNRKNDKTSELIKEIDSYLKEEKKKIN